MTTFDWRAAPDEILMDVIAARQLHGEDLDDQSHQVQKMVLSDIRKAQQAIYRSIIPVNPTDILVLRAIRVAEDELLKFEERGLGVCWAIH